MRKETISYSDLGHVYPGDYYTSIPYEDYLVPQAIPQGKDVFDLRSFGAVPGECFVQTETFLKAAKHLSENGGGMLLVRGGVYITGTFSLPDHTTLFIAPDAEIRASRNADDLLLGSEEQLHKGESDPGALLHIKNAAHVRITGGGVISGSGEWYVHEPKEKPLLTPHAVTMLPSREEKEQINAVPGSVRTLYRERIRYVNDRYGEGKPDLRRPSCMVWFDHCSNIEVDHIILRDSMCWTLNLDTCDHVLVHDMVIDDNRHVANTDGIDITGSSYVTIHHCFISCADDGVVLKNPAHTQRAMQDIHVSDCTIMTVMNALKIGTETVHPIQHVVMENCVLTLPDIYPGSVSGISIESCDGSDVYDISVRNIQMNNVLCPFYLCLNMRNRTGDPYTDEPGTNRYWGGSIEKVHIENVTAKGVELPCIVTGFSTQNKHGTTIHRTPKDISISSFRMTYRDNQEVLRVPPEIPEFLTDYPESNAHGDVPACGLWARHIDGMALHDFIVAPRSCNKRPDLLFNDCHIE